MFDLGKIAETVTAMFNSGPAATDFGEVTQQLADFGIDPATLDGLDATQIVELLGQHGIDLTRFETGQLAELLGPLGNGADHAATVGQWLTERLGRS